MVSHKEEQQALFASDYYITPLLSEENMLQLKGGEVLLFHWDYH